MNNFWTPKWRASRCVAFHAILCVSICPYSIKDKFSVACVVLLSFLFSIIPVRTRRRFHKLLTFKQRCINVKNDVVSLLGILLGIYISTIIRKTIFNEVFIKTLPKCVSKKLLNLVSSRTLNILNYLCNFKNI